MTSAFQHSALSRLKRKFLPLTNLQRFFCHPSQSSSDWDYDVFISGGGVVGMALASKLLKETQGTIKIGVVEPSMPKSLKDLLDDRAPDVRVYALSPQTIGILESVDAWRFIKQRSQPYKYMQIWESSGPGFVKFDAGDIGVEELGRVAEDQTIQLSLLESIKESPHNESIDLIFGASISSIAVNAAAMGAHGPASVTYAQKGIDGSSSTKTVTARLVVAADGANSSVRRLSGLATWGWGYGQEAVVATVRTRGDSIAQATAWQRYLPTGPLALLPLWDNYSSIVWSVPSAEAARLRVLPEAAFLSELNEALLHPPDTHNCSQEGPSDPSQSQWSSSSSPFRGWLATSPLGAQGGPASALLSTVAGVADAACEVLGGGVRRVRVEAQALADTALAAAHLAGGQGGNRLPSPATQLVGPRVAFPLQLQQASSYIKPRVVLVGDAAHSIHPQAGQGFNQGLADVRDLSAALVSALASGQDIGSPSVLRHYGDKSYGRNLAMLGTVDLINRLFAFGSRHDTANSPWLTESRVAGVVGPPFKAARSLALVGMHNLPLVKSKIAKYAMGTQEKSW